MGNYIVDLTDVPPIAQEPWALSADAQTYHVGFFYTYTPDVKIFWQSQMSFWTKMLNGYIESTTAIKNAVKETVSPADSQLDKARKLYTLAQKIENTDFNSDGAPLSGSEWIPRGKVESVLLARKGSSNEIAYLYLALVRTAGIHARPERIASRSIRVFSAQYMSNIQLDTVLIELNIDGKEILVDPGTKMAPFETLHWAHAGAGGVAMDASNKVQILVTPMQKNTDNNNLQVGTVNITAQGAVSGTLKLAFIGQSALEMRQLGLKSGADAVKAKVQKLISERVPDGVQAEVDHLTYLDDPNKQLLAVIQVSGSFKKNADGQIVLPRFFFEARETNPFPADATRELPIDMQYPAQEQAQITYVLPPGFTLSEDPRDANLKWEGNAVYQLHTKVEGGSVIASRILARGFTLLDPKEYDQFRDFYQKVVAADQQQLSVKRIAGNHASLRIQSEKARPLLAAPFVLGDGTLALEQVPERLVVDLVVELHFRSLDERSELARAAVGGGLLQIGKAALHIRAQNFGDPLRRLEVLDGRLNMVRQIALGLAQVLDLGRAAVDAGLEDGVQHQVGIGIRRDGAHLDAHRPRVADRHAHHRTAIGGRSLDLVGRFEVRIEPAVGIHAGVQDQAEVQRVGQDAVDELPAERRRASPGPSRPRTGWSCPWRRRRWCACRCR